MRFRKYQKLYFEVKAKCGHVGRNNYIPISFAVCAKDGKEAARKVRDFPRVKHDHKDAILSVEEICYDTYLEIKNRNNEDPYLQCHTKQEQKKTCNLSGRLCIDEHNQKKKIDKNLRKSKIAYKARKAKELEMSFVEEDY